MRCPATVYSLVAGRGSLLLGEASPDLLLGLVVGDEGSTNGCEEGVRSHCDDRSRSVASFTMSEPVISSEVLLKKDISGPFCRGIGPLETVYGLRNTSNMAKSPYTPLESSLSDLSSSKGQSYIFCAESSLERNLEGCFSES